MAGLCEGGNEPPGSLNASNMGYTHFCFGLKSASSYRASGCILGVQFKVCHGSLYAVMWLADEPREFNLPTLRQKPITYVPEKLPSKYGVHSEEYLPTCMVTPVVAGM
ncbi:hypothetical protein ANN_25781 [Periplaneta americana]|uniref:Uncharacterized protein n=1 Tax=Periplaneta americana TaxID=6978 RepID=A0ABQ8S442_PERAM|nr:hypothetical protein ANN_25781 [Periplaneta americana]